MAISSVNIPGAWGVRQVVTAYSAVTQSKTSASVGSSSYAQLHLDGRQAPNGFLSGAVVLLSFQMGKSAPSNTRKCTRSQSAGGFCMNGVIDNRNRQAYFSIVIAIHNSAMAEA